MHMLPSMALRSAAPSNSTRKELPYDVLQAVPGEFTCGQLLYVWPVTHTLPWVLTAMSFTP